MRFLSLYKTVEQMAPLPPEELAALCSLIEDGMKEGWLLSSEGCMPMSLGFRVRRSGSVLNVADGAFASAKDAAVGGFAILNAATKEEAVELSKRFLSVVGDGECEVLQLFDVSPMR